jgi:hypothetical protein
MLFGRLSLPVDLGNTCPDQRNQIAPDRNRVLRVFKSAQQERRDAEPVIF